MATEEEFNAQNFGDKLLCVCRSALWVRRTNIWFRLGVSWSWYFRVVDFFFFVLSLLWSCFLFSHSPSHSGARLLFFLSLNHHEKKDKKKLFTSIFSMVINVDCGRYFHGSANTPKSGKCWNYSKVFMYLCAWDEGYENDIQVIILALSPHREKKNPQQLERERENFFSQTRFSNIIRRRGLCAFKYSATSRSIPDIGCYGKLLVKHFVCLFHTDLSSTDLLLCVYISKLGKETRTVGKIKILSKEQRKKIRGDNLLLMKLKCHPKINDIYSVD